MATFLALLAILLAVGIHVERERAGPERRDPRRALVLPERSPRHPPSWLSTVAEFPFPPRDGQWGDSAGKIWPPLLQDGFGLQGPGPRLQGVRADARGVADDAIDAAQWLAVRPCTAPGGVASIGWSNGGSTVLAMAHVAPDMPPGLIQTFASVGERRSIVSWKPSAPIMILMSEDDDWTPAPPGLILSIKSVLLRLPMVYAKTARLAGYRPSLGHRVIAARYQESAQSTLQMNRRSWVSFTTAP